MNTMTIPEFVEVKVGKLTSDKNNPYIFAVPTGKFNAELILDFFQHGVEQKYNDIHSQITKKDPGFTEQSVIDVMEALRDANLDGEWSVRRAADGTVVRRVDPVAKLAQTLAASELAQGLAKHGKRVVRKASQPGDVLEKDFKEAVAKMLSRSDQKYQNMAREQLESQSEDRDSETADLLDSLIAA